ncbi:unnamed protein product, partial [Closterium sp. Naga37s-1]
MAEAAGHTKAVAAPFSIALAPPHAAAAAAAAAPGPNFSAPNAAPVAGDLETPLIEPSRSLGDTADVDKLPSLHPPASPCPPPCTSPPLPLSPPLRSPLPLLSPPLSPPSPPPLLSPPSPPPLLSPPSPPPLPPLSPSSPPPLPPLSPPSPPPLPPLSPSSPPPLPPLSSPSPLPPLSPSSPPPLPLLSPSSPPPLPSLSPSSPPPLPLLSPSSPPPLPPLSSPASYWRGPALLSSSACRPCMPHGAPPLPTCSPDVPRALLLLCFGADLRCAAREATGEDQLRPLHPHPAPPLLERTSSALFIRIPPLQPAKAALGFTVFGVLGVRMLLRLMLDDGSCTGQLTILWHILHIRHIDPLTAAICTINLVLIVFSSVLVLSMAVMCVCLAFMVCTIRIDGSQLLHTLQLFGWTVNTTIPTSTIVCVTLRKM